MGYPKDVYRKARQMLDTRREQARQVAQERKLLLYTQFPRLEEIERSLADTGLAAARAAVIPGADITVTIKRLEQENLALQRERAEILRAQGKQPDYLSPAYTCVACQDTGYIAQQRCCCMQQLLRQLAYRLVSDNCSINDCCFENFSLDYYPQEATNEFSAPRSAMRQILQICTDYAKTFSSHSESLLFFGNTGLGKTHLSLSIAREVIDRGFGVYYTSCQRLTDRLHAVQFGRAAEEETNHQELALDCDLLILDDLGAEFSTSFTIAALQSIINTRLSENRPTIISTNLDVNMISERYSERLASRLFCAYRSLPFYGEDIRLLKRYAK